MGAQRAALWNMQDSERGSGERVCLFIPTGSAMDRGDRSGSRKIKKIAIGATGLSKGGRGEGKGK